jgi:hypothetical protein
MAAQFCPLINQAAAAVPNFRASMLWKTPDAIAQLLSPCFLALVHTNRNPCLRYHIFGSCEHELPIRAQVDTRPESGHSHGNPGSGQSLGRGAHRQGPMGKHVRRDRVCTPAPLPQHLATGTPLPLHRRGPDSEASLQMLMGATPVGQENPKQKPPRAKVTWELPPLPLSPITHPLLWEHLPSQMGHPVENPPPMTTMDMLMDSLRQTGPLPEIRAANAILPEDPLFIYPITKAHEK